MFYHLYNQVGVWYISLTNAGQLIYGKQLSIVLSMIFQLATNTLERVAPLTHAVGNVLKRVFVIGFSIIVFGMY